MKSKLKWFFESFIWLGVLLLGIDILTKNIIVANKENIMSQGGIVIIPNFLRINYVINPNIAFGMSLGNPVTNKILFSIVALAISAGIIVFLVTKWGKVNKFYRAVAMMVIAGALGNVIDRIFYSGAYLGMADGKGGFIEGVVDWIDFYGIWSFNFNIADSCVVVAAFMVIIAMAVSEIKEYKNKPKPVEENNGEKILSKTEQEKAEMMKKDKEANE